jgi:hypothetical protein
VIRYRIVAPGCTLVAEAVTAMFAAAAGVGGGVGLPLVLVVGVGVGVGVAGLVALTTLPALPGLLPLAEPVPVTVGVGVGELAALVAAGELAGAVAEAELAAWVSVALAVPEAAGDAEADGELAARAVHVAPLVMTKRPVARPTVTGRECGDRMRTPCLLWLSRLENIPFGTVCHSEGSRCLLVTTAPIRHQNRHSTPPLRHTSPRIASASSRASRPRAAPGLVVSRPNSPTV